MMKAGAIETFFSHGNLIISGEYFVVQGAKALAVPLKYGQDLSVQKNSGTSILWEANVLGKSWFKAEFSMDSLDLVFSNDPAKSAYLKNLLLHIKDRVPDLFEGDHGYHFTSNIQFDTQWGWGSSAALIVNISKWARLDPFWLHSRVSNGSGYDIAAALSSGPILFQKNDQEYELEETPFNPPFRDKLYFVWLGRKQHSEESITKLGPVLEGKLILKDEVSELSQEMAEEENFENFKEQIIRHEEILSKTLRYPTVKKQYFKDFKGEMKSLGAWGGDFIMAASGEKESRVRTYFRDKGYPILFGFDELIRN